MAELRGRRVLGLLITIGALALVGSLFFRAAADTATATRGNACRAMQPDPIPDHLANQPPPDFNLTDANGKSWSLAALRGRPVLLNFWATWCPPCVEEMPSMEDLAKRMGNDAVILAISVDETWDIVKNFFPQGTPLSVLLDPSKDVPKKYGTEKYPETFLIDAAGHLRHAFINKRKWNSTEAVLCVESVR